MSQQERQFIVSVIDEDVEEHLRVDLESTIRLAVGQALGLDDGVGFNVEEA
jgi:hypothetical protein